MKNRFFVTIIIIFLIFSQAIAFSQDVVSDVNISEQTSEQDQTSASDQSNDELEQIKSEIAVIKKDLEEVKERTSWMQFLFQGATRITWGLNIWADQAAKGETAQLHSMPIATGFDMENDILFRMNFANKVLAKSFSSTEDGTEIFVKMKIDSYGVSELKPKGSWYVVDATTDMGKRVQVYMPRSSGTASNVVFGDLSVVLDQARVSRIAGTGFYFDYSDVTQVSEYYGVNVMTDVMVLNHQYFNNGYFYDRNDNTKYASLYYSFDTRPFSYLTGERVKYNATSGVAEAVKMWSNGMLRTSSTYDASTNQHPHGLTIGYEDDITKGFYAHVALGAASKDAFDPKYYEDNNIDYGFFLRGGVKLHSDKFTFWPKLNLSVAFQTETTEDYDYGWVTFASSLTLPFIYNLPTGENDYAKIEANWSINAQFALMTVATMFSIYPEFRLLNSKLFFKLPIVFSYKNGTGGFLRAGNASVKWIDQLYEDVVYSMSFVVGFDSTNLFGEIFEFILTNKMHFTYMYSQFDEAYLYEIVRFDFAFNHIPSGPLKFDMFVEFGMGYAYNARLVDSNTYLKYEYDDKHDRWLAINTDKELEWTKFSGTVLRVETGFYFDVIENFSVGFSAESPYLLANFVNPIGNQQTFGTFKLWSEIRF